jgi:hypothetical protein
MVLKSAFFEWWHCSNHLFLLCLFVEFWSDIGCWQKLFILCSFVDGMIEDVMLTFLWSLFDLERSRSKVITDLLFGMLGVGFGTSF